MLLCIITGVTALNSSFYVGFAFFSNETMSTYEWVLTQISELYQHLNIPDPVFIGTDCEVGLITAIEWVFPNTNHGLCLWHVDKNVLKTCNPQFDTHEVWTAIYDHWHRVMYASSEAIYEEEWKSLQEKYEGDYWSVIFYLREELLRR